MQKGASHKPFDKFENVELVPSQNDLYKCTFAFPKSSRMKQRSYTILGGLYSGARTAPGCHRKRVMCTETVNFCGTPSAQRDCFCFGNNAITHYIIINIEAKLHQLICILLLSLIVFFIRFNNF